MFHTGFVDQDDSPPLDRGNRDRLRFGRIVDCDLRNRTAFDISWFADQIGRLEQLLGRIRVRGRLNSAPELRSAFLVTAQPPSEQSGETDHDHHEQGSFHGTRFAGPEVSHARWTAVKAGCDSAMESTINGSGNPSCQGLRAR